uniref:CSON006548 protein n=1 Tax=Culicoides sonorensis TaxID=179676 RepID=A0A336L910_CULSO
MDPAVISLGRKVKFEEAYRLYKIGACNIRFSSSFSIFLLPLRRLDGDISSFLECFLRFALVRASGSSSPSSSSSLSPATSKCLLFRLRESLSLDPIDRVVLFFIAINGISSVVSLSDSYFVAADLRGRRDGASNIFSSVILDLRELEDSSLRRPRKISAILGLRCHLMEVGKLSIWQDFE